MSKKGSMYVRNFSFGMLLLATAADGLSVPTVSSDVASAMDFGGRRGEVKTMSSRTWAKLRRKNNEERPPEQEEKSGGISLPVSTAGPGAPAVPDPY